MCTRDKFCKPKHVCQTETDHLRKHFYLPYLLKFSDKSQLIFGIEARSFFQDLERKNKMKIELIQQFS